MFLVGKQYREKNLIKRLKQEIGIKKYQHRLEKARKSIKSGTHTLDETICYMQEQYDMTEADYTYPRYEEYMRRMRFSLVQRERIDLLPKRPKLKGFLDAMGQIARLAGSGTRACTFRGAV